MVLTIFLRQRGSSESKDCNDELYDPEDLKVKPGSPWPVKKGGIILSVYKRSLSPALFLLVFLSFGLHWFGSRLDQNKKQSLEANPDRIFKQFMSSDKFGK